MLAQPDRALVFPRFRDVGFLFFLPLVALFFGVVFFFNLLLSSLLVAVVASWLFLTFLCFLFFSFLLDLSS